MAISTQLVASLAAGGTSITAVTVPRMSSRETYTWGESGKPYLIIPTDGKTISSSGNVSTDASSSGVPLRVVPGPIAFSGNSIFPPVFLCIEVATN